MKAIRILGRGIRDAFKSVFRNFSLSTAAIACSSITLILVAVSMIVSYNVKNITKDLEHELSIVVYISKEATDEEIESLKSSLDNMENVESYTYKSKDEWKLEMKNSSEALNTTLEYLDENPLLDSFVVTVKDVNGLKKTTQEILENDFVESADYGEGMAENLVSAFNVIEKVTIIIVIALILVTAFLISNTIKLTIFSRRSEIEIMRLVGASNTTIKLPFIFEGLILGFLGSIIPILVAIYGYVILYDHFDGYIFTRLIALVEPFNFILYVSLILLIIGCVIGMFGSYRAVRKYLKI
jgi:cell division transport system permease protein